MPVTHRQRLLAISAAAAAALIAVPTAAPVWAQGAAGTSRMPQTTQTTPQEGAVSGSPGARAGGNAGQGTTQTVPGNNAGSPRGGEASDRQVPPHMQGQGHTQGQGGAAGGTATNPGSSMGPTRAPGDNAPGNPPTSNPNPGRRSDAGTAPGASEVAAVDPASLRDGRRASRVIGAALYNENNESVGEVDDIVLPANGGAPVVAVVSVGGFLGIGAKLVAVPFERLRAAGGEQRNRWTLTGAASREDLNRLPTFSYDATAAGRG
jgi:sporulation protein YlmC with PRC-barrel domain